MKSFLAVVKNLVFPPRCGGCHALLSPVAAGEDAVFVPSAKKSGTPSFAYSAPIVILPIRIVVVSQASCSAREAKGF